MAPPKTTTGPHPGGCEPVADDWAGAYFDLVVPLVPPAPDCLFSLCRSIAFSTLFLAVLASWAVMVMRYSERESLPSLLRSACLKRFDTVGLAAASVRDR